MPQLVLERVRNIRDIGGVVTRSGRQVAEGRLVRSASPHEMTDADRAALLRLGVRTMIDLRTRWERDRQPYTLAGADLLAVPLAAEDAVSSITERFMAGDLTSAELEDWWSLVGIYDAPETQAAGIRRVFDALLQVAPGEAVLFHCRGGKDRTGLIAALALETLGVDRALVLQDFLLSRDAPHRDPTAEAEAMRAAMEKMELSRAAIRSLSGVRAEWLSALLERVEADYGSVAAYLSDHIGIGADGVDRFRYLYLDPETG